MLFNFHPRCASLRCAAAFLFVLILLASGAQLWAQSAPSIIRITQPPKLTVPPTYPGGPIDLCVEVSNIQWDIDQVVYLEGETEIGTSDTAPYSYVWSNPSVGTHTITAKAENTNGDFSLSTSVTFTVTYKTPTIAYVTPQANNATYNTLAIIPLHVTAQAYDATITKVEYFDGQTLLGTVTSAPYVYQWTAPRLDAQTSSQTYTLTPR